MPYIYKITSPTGKIYVGSTMKGNVEHRWISYKSLKCKQQRKIYHSLLKHGVENHLFEVLEECSLEDMLNLECYYGEKFDVLGLNGLNLALPKATDTYIGMSSETKDKIRQNSINQFKDKQQRDNASKIKKQWFIDNKEKAAETFKKSKATRNTIENRQENSKKRLEFIKNNPIKWSEMKQKAAQTAKSDISRERQSNQMKQWIKDNPEEYAKFIQKSIDSRRTPIGIENNRRAQKAMYENGYKNPKCKLVLDTEYGIFYDSSADAARLLGLKISTLTGRLNGSKKNNTSLIYC